MNFPFRTRTCRENGPLSHKYWKHINNKRVAQGLKPYPIPAQKEERIERELIPMPDQVDQDMLSSEAAAWNPKSMTPVQGSDIAGNYINKGIEASN